LVSLLYPGALTHAQTKAFFLSRSSDDWLTSQWSRFETVNALRQLCRDAAGPKPPVIEAIRRLFKYWHRRGPFMEWDADLELALQESNQISTSMATVEKMRSADVLHLGMMLELQPGLFVTRDEDQHQLALSIGFPSQLLP
jgi:hypothetical protein